MRSSPLRLPVGCVVCATVAVLFATAVRAEPPSFDCTKATSRSEQLVCTDAELAALDRKVADLYRRTLESADKPDQAIIKASQAVWISDRGACELDADFRACMARVYAQRMVELSIQSGSVEAPLPVSLLCEGAQDQPFTAVFYSSLDPPAVVLTYGSNQVIAMASASDSGPRYRAHGVEYWEHQGESTVDWYGTVLKCAIKR